MNPDAHRAFAARKDLEKWLKTNHGKETELWVRMYKKDSGIRSVNWDDCVLACLSWGWIDGQRRGLDEVSFIQRLSPRRPKSTWSKKNCEHAERLIAAGLMQPSGLVHVEAARADGRWEAAYASPSEMVVPADFLVVLETNAEAKAFYATLNRQNQYAIYHRLQTAKRPETRAKRIADFVAQLAQGKRFH